MSSSTPPLIFSQRRREAAWKRHRVRQKGEHAARYLIDDIAEDVLDRLGFMKLTPNRTLVIGPSNEPFLTRMGPDNTQIANPATLNEELPYSHTGFDLIVSNLTLGTVNDLPGALIHMRNALAAGGILMAQLIGAGSLSNLRKALLAADGERPSARMHPSIDVQSAAELLQRAGFERQVADSRTLKVRFSSIDQLVSDLRDQGLSNQLNDAPPPLSKEALNRARKSFADAADVQGKVTEVFEIVTLTGWK